MHLRYVKDFIWKWKQKKPKSRVSFLDRERLVNTCLVILAGISIPLVVSSLLRSLEHGWHPIYYLHLGCFLALSGGALLRHRLSLNVRRGIILGVLFSTAFVGLAVFGLVGGGAILFVMASAIAVLLMDLRGGLVTLGIGLVFFTAIAFLVAEGILVPAVDSGFALSPSAWTNIGTDVAFASLVIVMSFGRARSEMEASYYALEQSEGYLRQAQGLAKVGHWQLDIDQGKITGSDEFYRMFALSPEEVTLDVVTRMFFPSGGEQGLVALGSIIEKGNNWDAEHTVSLPNGEQKVVLSRGEAIQDTSGRTRTLLGTVQDITTQRRQERERESLREQLAQAEKLRALGQLAGGVAHDFNNQLTGMMGFADILQRELKAREDRTHAHFANQILTSAKRSAELIAQLLDFARKGKKLEKPIDVHEIIREVISILSRTLDKRVVIQQKLEADPSLTHGDGSQLQSALLNLGINARDAMPAGGELLFTTSRVALDESECQTYSAELSPGEYIKVSVIDTGTGIEESIRARIFEPFFTTKPLGKGTGMGLAAVYGAVQDHNGTVEVDSKKGQGSAFHVFLPLGTKEKEKEKVEEHTPSQTAQRSGKQILLIDDEPVVLDVVTKMFAEIDYRVSAYQTSKEALDFFRDHWRDINLVLLDMVMHDQGATEVFRALKEIHPAVKVLLISGYSFAGEARALMEAGADGFLQKPFRLDALSGEVDDILNFGKSSE